MGLNIPISCPLLVAHSPATALTPDREREYLGDNHGDGNARINGPAPPGSSHATKDQQWASAIGREFPFSTRRDEEKLFLFQKKDEKLLFSSCGVYKSRRNKKHIATAVCKSRDESNEPN